MKEEYYGRDRDRGIYATFTWLVEEVGELAEALLKKDLKKAEEEIADVIAWVISVANLLDIDVERVLIGKYPFLKKSC